MGNYGYNDEMSYCHWWIEAGKNDIIEVKVESISGTCSEGCIYGGIEIKAGSDKRLTGYRYFILFFLVSILKKKSGCKLQNCNISWDS
ncbi:unnamed protein product [Onchocerca flexuosa]|uniref:CUB domain-containing protein n=1 Tax=Onchocerca flexuosa TaxID=387005 RepID=A0A183I8P7_9BILA|nr:unnamed protein product [Onchocerca flexuosa]